MMGVVFHRRYMMNEKPIPKQKPEKVLDTSTSQSIDEIIYPQINEIIAEPGTYGWYAWIAKGLIVEKVQPIIKQEGILCDPLDLVGSVGIKFTVVKE